ncbi:MAG: helix-turn-helix domain-containing protein [Gammaproteobacteria bacterium]
MTNAVATAAPHVDTRIVQAVLAVGQAMATTRDHAQMLGAVIDAVCATLGAASGGFMRYDAERDELVLQAPAFGVHAERTVSQYRVSLADGGNAARVFLSREPYIANDTRHDARFIQRFVRLFETYNTVTVPLVLRDHPIGIFHAINKRNGDFTTADRDLLASVAPLLAACLQSALVFRAFEQERAGLARAIEAHERLLDAAVGAGGPDAVCSALHALLGRPLLLLDALRRPLVSLDWPLEPALVARALAAASLRDGLLTRVAIDAAATTVDAVGIPVAGARGGYLVVDTRAAPLDTVDSKAVEQAATLVAIEIFKRRSMAAAATRAASAVLVELFSEGVTETDARALLARLGLPSTGPWRVVVLDLDSADDPDRTLHQHGTLLREALERTLGSLRRELRLLHWRSGFVVIAAAAQAERLGERALARRLQQALDALDALPAPLRLRIGIGRVETSPLTLGISLKSAERAVQAIARLDIGTRVLKFEDLGVYRLLLGGNREDEHAEFVDQVLAPVRARDRHGSGTLLDTLATLVAHDFAIAPAARALGVHANTVKYRLNQLREAFGADPARGELRLEIELALKIRQIRRGA